MGLSFDIKLNDCMAANYMQQHLSASPLDWQDVEDLVQTIKQSWTYAPGYMLYFADGSYFMSSGGGRAFKTPEQVRDYYEDGVANGDLMCLAMYKEHTQQLRAFENKLKKHLGDF